MKKFELNQKVETPFGKGVITRIQYFNETYQEVSVQIGIMPEVTLPIEFIKEYISPHQRLLDLGFEWQKLSSRNSMAYSKYNYPFQDCLTVINVFKDECYLDVNTVGTPELFKILLDYTEELMNENRQD